MKKFMILINKVYLADKPSLVDKMTVTKTGLFVVQLKEKN